MYIYVYILNINIYIYIYIYIYICIYMCVDSGSGYWCNSAKYEHVLWEITLDIEILYCMIFDNFFKQTYMSLDFYKKCLNYLELLKNVRGTK